MENENENLDNLEDAEVSDVSEPADTAEIEAVVPAFRRGRPGVKRTPEEQEQARQTRIQKGQFFKAYSDHVFAHGLCEWQILFDKFPDISQATRWRWVKEAKKNMVGVKGILGTARVAAQKLVQAAGGDDRTKKVRRGTFEQMTMHKHLPAAPSPEYLSREGPRKIDFLSEIYALYADAHSLREYAITIKENEDGTRTENIKNPKVFADSIQQRAKLLTSAVDAVKEVWDLKTMQDFYSAIIEEIGKESPECRRRIMDRLARLNEHRGMTPWKSRI